jgi:predicted metal-binding membrane protein
MIYDAQELAKVRKPVLLASAAAWALLLLKPGTTRFVVHCPAPMEASATSLPMFLAMNSAGSLAAGWGLMLVAMMLPPLIQSLHHIRMSSFTQRRGRSMALFLIAYGALWMAVGAVLITAALVMRLFKPASYLPVAGVVLIALVWQFSPIKQRCLNRCHSHPALAVFRAPADFAALHFGIAQGIWCAGSCWALMLLPIFLPQVHVIAMAVVSLLIFSERLESPGYPCWRFRGFGKVIRIMRAQVRLRLFTLRSRLEPVA